MARGQMQGSNHQQVWGGHSGTRHNEEQRQEELPDQGTRVASNIVEGWQQGSGIQWESTNAVPHYHKLCSRVSRIWRNCRGQHIQSAMDKLCPGKTTFVVIVSPLPGEPQAKMLQPTPIPKKCFPNESCHFPVGTSFANAVLTNGDIFVDDSLTPQLRHWKGHSP
ncbi:hypothetical protein STEG23_028212 [Scotinomys teguina]